MTEHKKRAGRRPCSRCMPGKPVPYGRLPKCLRRKARMSLSKVTVKGVGAAAAGGSGAASGDVPSIVFERMTDGSQVFWKVVAEPEDAH